MYIYTAFLYINIVSHLTPAVVTVMLGINYVKCYYVIVSNLLFFNS